MVWKIYPRNTNFLIYVNTHALSKFQYWTWMTRSNVVFKSNDFRHEYWENLGDFTIYKALRAFNAIQPSADTIFFTVLFKYVSNRGRLKREFLGKQSTKLSLY